jgi:hypothetical protein
MIDTDKYEGHKPAPWRWFGLVNNPDGAILLVDADDYGLPLFQLNGEPTELDRPDTQLIADAPLILEDYKRLREAFITAVNHVGEHDLSRDDLFSKLDDDLFSLWLFRSE